VINKIVERVKENKKQILLASILIAVSAGWRVYVWKSGLRGLANIELVTLSAVLAGFFLKGSWRWLVPLAAVALADQFIPNSRTTMLYVWGAWALIGLFSQFAGSRMAKKQSRNALSPVSILLFLLLAGSVMAGGRVFTLTGEVAQPIVLGAIVLLATGLFVSFRHSGNRRLAAGYGLGIGSVIFFFLATNFGVWLEGWYPMTMAGLLDCFIKALPFLERQLRTNLLVIPTVFAAIEWMRSVKLNHQYQAQSVKIRSKDR